MAVSRKEKEETLAILTEELKSAKGVVFAQYRGMTVKQLDTVRKSLRKENVKLQVVKVTLLKKALTALGIKIDNLEYSGPIALAVSNDEETAPARILKSMMTKENPFLALGGGVFNHELIGVAMVNKFASIPSKPQLLGQLMYVLTGNVRSLLYALNGIKDKKQ